MIESQIISSYVQKASRYIHFTGRYRQKRKSLRHYAETISLYGQKTSLRITNYTRFV